MFQLEYQRQQLLQERQLFHNEQIRAAEHRARQIAMQHLVAEQKQSPAQQAGDGGMNLIVPNLYIFDLGYYLFNIISHIHYIIQHHKLA